MQLRLDKYLADMGLGSRKEVKALVRGGLIYVNGWRVRKADAKVNTETDIVEYNHERIVYVPFEYWMLNKPAGFVSATRDNGSETVVDLVPSARKDLFPVGRLDKDTVGLLLVTNDGQLAHRLLAPGKHVDKCYFARLEHGICAEDIQAFAEGIDIGDDALTLPARLAYAHDAQNAEEVLVTLHEGRYHQVKRMFEARGNKVTYLKRISMGPLTLDPALAEGESRPLAPEELACIL